MNLHGQPDWCTALKEIDNRGRGILRGGTREKDSKCNIQSLFHTFMSVCFPTHTHTTKLASGCHNSSSSHKDTAQGSLAAISTKEATVQFSCRFFPILNRFSSFCCVTLTQRAECHRFRPICILSQLFWLLMWHFARAARGRRTNTHTHTFPQLLLKIDKQRGKRERKKETLENTSPYFCGDAALLLACTV